MTRLHITAEGATEERFVNDCLCIYLASYQVYCDVRKVLTSEDSMRHIEYRGGFRRVNAYTIVRRDITNWLAEDHDPNCYFTTMFDYYALPIDFPGMRESQHIANPYERIQYLEEALSADIHNRRFIPYIQLHEFEALIFAAPQNLILEYPDCDAEIASLVRISEHFDNPELINQSPLTAPSKRIIAAIPEHAHNKPAGALVAQEIGIPKLREKCPHFDEWLAQLTCLPQGITA